MLAFARVAWLRAVHLAKIFHRSTWRESSKPLQVPGCLPFRPDVILEVYLKLLTT